MMVDVVVDAANQTRMGSLDCDDDDDNVGSVGDDNI